MQESLISLYPWNESWRWSFQSEQTHNEKLESLTKDLKLFTDGSISSDQLKELIKEATKTKLGLEVDRPLPMPNHTLKG